MHSLQPSRGRIFLEVLCALTISASFAGAWLQTGATALLPAAGVSLLYAIVHLFDMRRRSPIVAVEPQRIDYAPDGHVEQPAHREVDVPVASVDPQPATEPAIQEIEPVEALAPRTGASRRKGGSRKGNGRRVAAKEAKVTELAVAQEVAADEPALPEAADATVSEPVDQSEAIELEPAEPIAHVPHAPLFEPEPFVRMPRQAFGRRGRI
jgi:hypothetical protein